MGNTMISGVSLTLAEQHLSCCFNWARDRTLFTAMIGKHLLWYKCLDLSFHWSFCGVQIYIFTVYFLLSFQILFKAPLYWDIYAPKGLNSARICFTCHNFEYQGTAPASELALCGLDVSHLNRPDRMQDHSAHDRINPLKVMGPHSLMAKLIFYALSIHLTGI